MSSIAPNEVVPRAGDEPSPQASSGLKPAHVAGGGVSVVVGAVVVAICNHYGWDVSNTDALVIGGATVSAGAGLGHVIGKVGVFGAVKQFLHGRSA